MNDERSIRQDSGADSEKREAQRVEQLRKELQAADLDEALANSFPASDPPSMIAPQIRVGSPNRDLRRTAVLGQGRQK